MASVSRPRAGNQRKPARPPHGLARLMLVVNGTSYTIRTIPCDPSAALKAFRLRKVDGTHYNVATTEYGPVCDCPDFVFNRDGIDPDGCKHIKAMIAVGLIEKGGAQ
jgi:hypothetical protein